jgi:hypothetical protein
MFSAADSLEDFYAHFQDLLATDLEVDEIWQDLRGELVKC